MSKESNRKIELELQRLSQVALMAKEAFERQLPEGQFGGKEFVVFTGEPAEILVRWSKGLNSQVDFVVTYKEGERFKQSIVKDISNDEITVIEPALAYNSTIMMDQFNEEWRETDRWLMMVRK